MKLPKVIATMHRGNWMVALVAVGLMVSAVITHRKQVVQQQQFVERQKLIDAQNVILKDYRQQLDDQRSWMEAKQEMEDFGTRFTMEDFVLLASLNPWLIVPEFPERPIKVAPYWRTIRKAIKGPYNGKAR